MPSDDMTMCRAEIAQLQGEIARMQNSQFDPDKAPLAAVAARSGVTAAGASSAAAGQCTLRQRRQLRGHFGKIYALDWATDSKHLVSASQDGKLIVWNGFTTNKTHVVPLRSSWVMCVAYSPQGSMVACGGLDNLCSVYRLPGKGGDVSSIPSTAQQLPYKAHAELAQHDGYLSSAKFVSEGEVVTGSGDATCMLWDVETRQVKNVFNDHQGDVMSVDLAGEGSNLLLSGSTDATAKAWDLRTWPSSPVRTFHGHEADINSVRAFPDGNAFGTGSDDSTVRLFDLRSYGQVNRYADDRILCGVTSVDFSHTGRFLFAGYEDYGVRVWDSLVGAQVDTLNGHDDRVSCLRVTKDGRALATGSWDNLLKIWA